jgi:hypothetical protein
MKAHAVAVDDASHPGPEAAWREAAHQLQMEIATLRTEITKLREKNAYLVSFIENQDLFDDEDDEDDGDTGDRDDPTEDGDSESKFWSVKDAPSEYKNVKYKLWSSKDAPSEHKKLPQSSRHLSDIFSTNYSQVDNAHIRAFFRKNTEQIFEGTFPGRE